MAIFTPLKHPGASHWDSVTLTQMRIHCWLWELRSQATFAHIQSYYHMGTNAKAKLVAKTRKGSGKGLYGSIWVAIFNLKCNMQNDNAICKMVMHFCI